MAGVSRWRAAIVTFILLALTSTVPVFAEDPVKTDAVAEEAIRQFETGKRQMGQNNPTHAAEPETLTLEARNLAGQFARGTFRALTTRYPDFADGWLWLGIALTEMLAYTRDHPNGVARPTPAEINEGLVAFAEAYKRRPADFTTVVYYGEALLTYRQEFDKARNVWDAFLAVAETDMQQVTALVQAGRACLNKAFFGKRRDKMPADEVKRHYQVAADYVARAAKLCPNARDVRDMQALLTDLRKELTGE